MIVQPHYSKKALLEKVPADKRELAVSKLNELALGEIRTKRDALIKATDSYALQDRVMSEEMKAYRQALRDLPTSIDMNSIDSVLDVEFPTKP